MRILALSCLISIHCFATLDWQPPITVGTIGSSPLQPEMAINASGQTVAVWPFFDGVATFSIQASNLTFGGTWSAPVTIPLSTSTSSNPVQTAIDPSGNAFAVWIQNNTMQASVQPGFAGVWTPATLLSMGLPGNSGNPLVAAFDSGIGVAVWDQNSTILESSLYNPTAMTWTLTQITTGVNVQSSSIAINSNGFCAVTWAEILGGQYSVNVSTATIPSSGSIPWSAPFTASTIGNTAIRSDVAVDPQGNIVVVFTEAVGADTLVRSARYSQATMMWSVLADITTTGIADTPSVAVDANGNAVAVWARSTGGPNDIESSILLFGAPGWTPFQTLATGGSAPQVSVSPGGEAVAVWAIVSMANVIIQSSDLQPGSSTWSTPVDLIQAGMGLDSFSPRVGTDAFGDSVAVWQMFDGGISTYFTESAQGFGPTLPPTNPGGFQLINRFPARADYINFISWSPLSGNTIFFRIYRNNLTDLIAETTNNSYQDHLRVPGETTTYLITSVNSFGFESAPISITVTPVRN